MKIRKIFVSVVICIMCVICSSCEPSFLYNSGTYMYSYYLINDLNDDVIMHQQFRTSEEQTVIAAGDTLRFAMWSVSHGSNDLEGLHRPALEDGYESTIQTFPTTLTINGMVYEVNKEQEHSFMRTANYEGMQDPNGVFYYNYYFHIDDAYLASFE